MSILDALHKYEPELEFQYQALLNGLDWADGFALFFVECSPAKANNIYNRLNTDLSTKQHYFLKLEQPIENLYDYILTIPAIKNLDILFISGIEKSFTPYIKDGYGGVGDYYKEDSVPRVLGHLNLEREKLREQLPNLRFVFFLPKFGMKYFIRRAADFFDWRSGYFQFIAERDLLELFYQTDNKNKVERRTNEQKKARILELQAYIDEPALPAEQRAEYFYEQGYLWAMMKNYEAAIAIFNQTIQTKPNHELAWYNLGNALYNLGKLDEAITAYQKQLEIKPNHEKAWNNLGIALYDLGKLDEAVAAYQKQLDINPNHELAWYNLGNALYNLGKLDEAITAYQKQIDINPNHESAWYNLGISLNKLGKFDEAVAAYQKQIEIKPNHESAWNNLGTTLLNLEKLDEAVAAYQKQLNINPNHESAWYNLGISLNKLGKFDEAVAAYQKQLEINPNHESAWYNLGVAYLKQNKLSMVEQSWAKALEINATHLSTLSNDAELALIQHDDKRCLQRIERALTLVNNKDQKYSILLFLAWLAEPTGSYQPVLNAIAQLDPSVKFTWDFSDTEPAIQHLTTAQQLIARQFIAYFQGNSDKLPDGIA